MEENKDATLHNQTVVQTSQEEMPNLDKSALVQSWAIWEERAGLLPKSTEIEFIGENIVKYTETY